MQEKILKIGYGNCQIGDKIDEFWLKGPLKISAIEQIYFIVKLVKNELPFSKNHQNIVQQIILLENNNRYKLYGKTGWAMNIGWWVGWVKTQNNIYCFALNMDMTDIKDAPKRIKIGKKALKALGII